MIKEEAVKVLASATDLLEKAVHQAKGGTQPRLSVQKKIGHAYMDACAKEFSFEGNDLKQLSEILKDASLFSIEEEDGKCVVSITVPDVVTE